MIKGSISVTPTTNDNIFCNSICNNINSNVQYTLTYTSNVYIAYNYWCTIDSTAIDSGIYDGYDDISLGLVEYKPYNMSPCDIPLSISDTHLENNPIKIFPNPNNGNFTLALSNPDSYRDKDCTVEIYNVLGEKVYTETLHSVQGDKHIDISSQPSGIYFYRVLEQNGDLVGSGKMVIDK